MLSLIFGLIAALAWGVHDVCVRFAVGRAGVPLAFATVLGGGLVLRLPVVAVSGAWSLPAGRALWLSVGAGFSYAAAGYALYSAFELGPVRVVAPVIGSFPILSVLWAAANGTAPGAGQIGAILAIVAGVGLAAALGDQEGQARPQRRAIGWSVLACCGFALTFAIGQQANVSGGLTTTLVARAVSALAMLGVLALMGPQRPAGAVPWGLLMAMAAADITALTLVFLAGSLPHPEYAAVSSSTFGMITILLARIFLKEPLSPSQGLAILMVFGGIGYLAA